MSCTIATRNFSTTIIDRVVLLLDVITEEQWENHLLENLDSWVRTCPYRFQSKKFVFFWVSPWINSDTSPDGSVNHDNFAQLSGSPETKKTKEDRVGRALPMPTTNGSCMGPAQMFQAFTTGWCIDLCRATVLKRESLWVTQWLHSRGSRASNICATRMLSHPRLIIGIYIAMFLMYPYVDFLLFDGSSVLHLTEEYTSSCERIFKA